VTTRALPTLTVPVGRALDGYPVAVIGAGPVGLAAAAHLLERGIDVVVLEAGPSAGTTVAEWGHIRLFSPWEYLIDAAAARLLDASDWHSPAATRMPYGRDLVTEYLLPLAATPELAPRIRYGSTVTDVSRRGMDRTRSANRGSTPFLLRIRRNDETTEQLARAVIDTSGTWATPNGLTASGLAPASGAAVRGHISPGLPDVLGADRDGFAGKHTVVVGAGHSAANSLLNLAALARVAPGTRAPGRSGAPARFGCMGRPPTSSRDAASSAAPPTTSSATGPSLSSTTSRSTTSYRRIPVSSPSVAAAEPRCGSKPTGSSTPPDSGRTSTCCGKSGSPSTRSSRPRAPSPR
jgi:hypothetical protein